MDMDILKGGKKKITFVNFMTIIKKVDGRSRSNGYSL